MIIREFDSYTKEDTQEYRVTIKRKDSDFSCHVKGKFGDFEIERDFTATGETAEQQVQEWLYTLDQEIQEVISKVQSVGFN
jgi:hypothetical protein